MIGSNQYNLTWNHFTQIHDDARTAFENLCRTLFKHKFCSQDAILHSNPNHPGIEVEPVCDVAGLCRISFQAKFFGSNVDYPQIKSSAEKIVDHYQGHIDKVYLYSNKDISTESKQYKDIVKMLNAAKIEMVPITGQTILDQVADYPIILATYFGLDYLGPEWFENNLQLSLDNLGKRYNATFNIDTNAQKQLEVFLREDAGICRINNKKKEIVNEIESLLWSCKSEERKYVESIRNKVLLIEDIRSNNIEDAFTWYETLTKACGDEISFLEERKALLLVELEKYSSNDENYREIRGSLYVINHILSLFGLLEISSKEKTCINAKVLLVEGTMGTGKTQLLASSAKRLTDNGFTVLLYLGQAFTSADPIDKQMINNVQGLSDGQTLESLMYVMEEAAEKSDRDAVIFVDAINESHNKEIWQHGINRLVAQVEEFNHIRLVLSLRSGFEKLTLSDKFIEDLDVNGRIAKIVHNGLQEDSPQAVYDFLSNAGVPFSPEYYLQSDMSNPLFLTWFCQTYTGAESELLSLINKVIEKADCEASRDAGSQVPFGAMEALLNSVISFRHNTTNAILSTEAILSFNVWETYGITNKVAYLKSAERFGVISTFVLEGQEHYYVGYNLLEEYLTAKQLLDSSIDANVVKETIKKALFETVNDEVRVNYNGIDSFTMAASLYASKYGEELVEIVDDINDEWDKSYVIDQYLLSIARRGNVPFDSFVAIINKYSAAPRTVWKVFIENATKVNSELNADGLTRLLMSYELNRRDYLWTTEINGLCEDDRIISLAYYIEKGNLFSSDENNIKLLLTLFAWLLSSSKRVLRDRVSKAMIEILKEQFQLCLPLLTTFKDVNDPYIIQRLFGIVFGAVMKRAKPFDEEYRKLTEWIITNIFDVDKVYPDILLRDYARLIVERYAYEFPDTAEAFDINKVRPPYTSDPISVVEPIDYGSDEYKADGISDLIFSMTFDLPVKGRGMYGDFGRYTFQSALKSFNNIDIENVFYYALEYIFNDLGYTSELFGEYDTQVRSWDRHYSKKTERIGKKYQWIAMYNILARLSDTSKVDCWWESNNNEGEDFSGPWEPYVRDFDPTLNIKYGINPMAPTLNILEYGSEEFIPPDSSEERIQQWVRDESKLFTDYPRRLIMQDDSGTEWIALYHYNETKVKSLENKGSFFGLPNGEQHIWTITNSFLTKSSCNNDEFLELIKKNRFANSSNKVRDCYTLYSREYAWSPGYKEEFKHIEYEDDESMLNGITSGAINVLWEEEFDASQEEETTSFMIPAGEIINILGLEEKKYDGYFFSGDELVAFDLKLTGNKHQELVIRKDYLQLFLKKTSSKLFWTIVGEKQFFRGNRNQIWQRREGYYIFDENGIVGELNEVDDFR
ncbi:MAG: hypothetical protein KBT27_14020 [Prevotellaceae bacterium]|nr:hypothetical protein [Candidatus Faecinaster equi]